MAGSKNVPNSTVEPITNTFFGNQFIASFMKVPQTGYYQDAGSKSLKSYYIDMMNESIRGVTLPETSVPMIPISSYAHQNTYFKGVGDCELGTISIRFLLDRYMNNYTALLNWSLIK